MMSVTTADRLYAKGAPDILLELCTMELRGEAAEPLTDERRASIQETITGLSAQGFRTPGVAPTLVGAARGIGMSRLDTFFRVELPLAWPVILAGMRVSAQMTMGIAAVAAYALGPGLGGYIFSGLSRLGGANSFESVATGVIAVVILALLLDLALILLGRFTISRGIRV